MLLVTLQEERCRRRLRTFLRHRVGGPLVLHPAECRRSLFAHCDASAPRISLLKTLLEQGIGKASFLALPPDGPKKPPPTGQLLPPGVGRALPPSSKAAPAWRQLHRKTQPCRRDACPHTMVSAEGKEDTLPWVTAWEKPGTALC